MAKIVIIGPYARSLLEFRGELMREMVGQGHEVLAMAPEKDYAEELNKIGVRYCSLPMERAGLNPFRDMYLFLKLVQLLRKIKPDIIFVYAIKPVIYASLAGLFTGVSQIYSMITGLGYVFTGEGLKQRVLRYTVKFLYKFALKRNNIVFFQNPDDMAAFVSYDLLDKDKAILINGSGVDLTKYCYIEPRTEPFSFLLIARLIWDKGIKEYVEAARYLKKKYPHVRFALLGPYDSNPTAIKTKEIDMWVKENIIDYLGETKDVRPFLGESSVYVLPSYREGTPRSVLEAMATGRPIITTDSPGCRETVRHGYNGFLVPVRNIDILIEVMEYFINNPICIKEMGLKSREIVIEKYDVRKVNKVILKALGMEVK